MRLPPYCLSLGSKKLDGQPRLDFRKENGIKTDFCKVLSGRMGYLLAWTGAMHEVRKSFMIERNSQSLQIFERVQKFWLGKVFLEGAEWLHCQGISRYFSGIRRKSHAESLQEAKYRGIRISGDLKPNRSNLWQICKKPHQVMPNVNGAHSSDWSLENVDFSSLPKY